MEEITTHFLGSLSRMIPFPSCKQICNRAGVSSYRLDACQLMTDDHKDKTDRLKDEIEEMIEVELQAKT